MLCANILPAKYNLITIQKFCGIISYYDMESKQCELFYKYFNENFGVFGTGKWKVEPNSVIENWGIDDTVILQAFADYMGYTITSFENN